MRRIEGATPSVALAVSVAVVGGAKLEQTHGLVDGAEGRHEEKWRRLRLVVPQLHEKIFPADVRQADVADDHVVTPALQVRERLPAALVPGMADPFHLEALA